ncbi:MAG: hypothetical protein ACREF7_00795, partial [Candidatus Saccharimonadales bacterium]
MFSLNWIGNSTAQNINYVNEAFAGTLNYNPGGGGGSDNTPPCGLCVMNPTANQALEVSGSGTINLTSGDIDVNSNAAEAFYAAGASHVTANAINVFGGEYIGGSASITPSATLGVAATPNPFADLPAPVVSTIQTGGDLTSGSSTVTLQPGVYSDLEIGGSNQVTLAPGIYVVTGAWELGGAATLTATNGVMIYFTCSGYSTTDTEPCNGTAGANFSTSNSGTFNIAGPTSGTYQNISLFADPGNTTPIKIEGAATDTLTGNVYAYDSALTVTGSGAACTLNAAFVVSKVAVGGSG